MNANHFQIRDPIHGVIFISLNERAVIDSLAFQRLRYIKQVGFADFAFPCATHSRYSHSLGAMFVASKIFDRVIAKESLPPGVFSQMRQAVRLSALLHDIGHPPLSHTSEMLMPMLSELDPHAPSNVRATHEDFTLRIILHSPLTQIIENNFSDIGVSPHMIASLLNKTGEGNFFRFSGVDYTPILRQIISSEIDADRMDYLLRDSFFCGVNYGKFDSDWLIDNLVSIEQGDCVFLGFKARAIFAFEDFLLSRYHMFLSVYLHHTPVIMEKMLERFFYECKESFSLPIDVIQYINLNDIDLWQTLRASQNQWAERIVHRKPYIMLDEQFIGLKKCSDQPSNHDEIIGALQDADIDVITSQSKGVLSTYFGKIKNPLFVENTQKKAVSLEEFSPVFTRYETPTEVFRIFIDGKDKIKAEGILHKMSMR